MRADRQRSGSVGASLAEVQAYVDIVMGRKTMYVCASCNSMRVDRRLSHICLPVVLCLQRGPTKRTRNGVSAYRPSKYRAQPRASPPRLTSPLHPCVLRHDGSSLQTANLPPADIAVLDENIDLEDEGVFVKGSDVARDLRAGGFRGIVCVLTGEDQRPVQQLAQLPHVDLAFQKGADPHEMARILLQVHAERIKCTTHRVARGWQPRLSVHVEQGERLHSRSTGS